MAPTLTVIPEFMSQSPSPLSPPILRPVDINLALGPGLHIVNREGRSAALRTITIAIAANQTLDASRFTMKRRFRVAGTDLGSLTPI